MLQSQVYEVYQNVPTISKFTIRTDFYIMPNRINFLHFVIGHGNLKQKESNEEIYGETEIKFWIHRMWR